VTEPGLPTVASGTTQFTSPVAGTFGRLRRRTAGTRRLATVAAVSVAFGLLLTVLVLYAERGLYPADEITYIAAGERLNAGHELYALQPGDRDVALKPPYWTAPLLSPPFIAVVWRPLAALPGEAGIWVWWAGALASIGLTVLAMLRRRPMLTSAALAILSVPLVYEIGVGNVNGYLLGGTVLAWYLLTKNRDVGAGAVVAVMASLKLTPIVLAWWLLSQRRPKAVLGAVVGGGIVLVISLAGAGLDAHLDYLRLARETNLLGASELSLAGLARTAGVDPYLAGRLPLATLAFGMVAILALRRRPRLAWVVAIATVLFGSPVVNVNWYAYLLAMVAPLVWPLPRPTGMPDECAEAAKPASTVGQ